MIARPPFARPSSGEDPPRHWIPAGIVGGLAGGLAVAWLLWGSPQLITSQLCFLAKAALVIVAGLVACAGGCSLVLTSRRLIVAVRQRIHPPLPWEPVEPIIEVELLSWPHAGCGLWALVPIVAISALISLPWFYLGLRDVPLGRALLSALLGVPFGLLLMRGEARAGRL